MVSKRSVKSLLTVILILLAAGVFTNGCGDGGSGSVDATDGNPPQPSGTFFYVDWVVENNLVITDHWHGISLYGAVDSRIVNNTVVDADEDPESPGPPWIMFHDHKDGTPSSGCLIRNNIAATISTSGDTVADHNYRLQDGDTLFRDPANGDYHLRADAGSVIDTGSADQAPTTDKEGSSRPQGAGVDLGCYEY